MQVGTFTFPLFWCLSGVYSMRIIKMVIVKETVLNCVIYAATFYHHSELDIPNFWVTWVLLWFGKGYNYIVLSDWSYINS